MVFGGSVISNSRRLRWAYLLLAYVSIGLGAIGVVLPGLPTTPFVLVAAWSASRGSRRLERWLYEHRHFGPALRAWRDERAVPRRGKWLAGVLMAACWCLLALKGAPAWGLAGLAVLFATVGGYVITRPEPGAGDQEEYDGF